MAALLPYLEQMVPVTFSLSLFVVNVFRMELLFYMTFAGSVKGRGGQVTGGGEKMDYLTSKQMAKSTSKEFVKAIVKLLLMAAFYLFY